MRKIIKNPYTNEYEDSSQMPVLFDTEFQLNSGEEVNDDEFGVISLKPNSSTERKIKVKDDIGHKGTETHVDFHFRFLYKVNNFIDFPEGTLEMRLDSSEVDALRETTILKETNSLKIYLSDLNKEIKDTPAYIFMERSLEEQFSQLKIQTYDWTNKIVIESYGSDDIIQARVLIHLSDIPFNSQEEVVKQVTLNGVRLNFVFGYTPLLNDDAQDITRNAGSLNRALDGKDTKSNKNRVFGVAENLKQRIKDLESDNLVLRTNVNKVNVIQTLKLQS